MTWNLDPDLDKLSRLAHGQAELLPSHPVLPHIYFLHVAHHAITL